jgi:serine/threonine-protein kinase
MVIDGRYELGRIIGSGGMGTVYEATQVHLDGKVALKLLRNKYAKSLKIVKRFHQEARLAGSIDHDNICKVTDHGTAENGAPYLVMPLLTGQSLAGLLESDVRPSQMRIIDIACQTLMALAAAHQEKIVHRDLKPDNIFVTRIGDRDDFVKLLDFGISKVLEGEAVSDLTATGMILGTAYYLAPEQAKGAKKIDHRVDIYAMGVILYEALTGRRPFEGETYNEVMFKIAGEPFKPPRALNPSIAPAVERVILQAMAIDPGRRFDTATKMCQALEEAMVSDSKAIDTAIADTMADTSNQEGESGGADKVSRGRRAGRWWMLGIAVAASVLAILASRFLLGSDGEEQTETAAQPPPRMEAPPPQDNPEVTTSEAPKVKTAKEEHPPEEARAPEPTPSPDAPEPPAAVSNKSEKPPQKKGAKRTKKRTPGEKGVIKGPFGTTFVFEEE